MCTGVMPVDFLVAGLSAILQASMSNANKSMVTGTDIEVRNSTWNDLSLLVR